MSRPRREISWRLLRAGLAACICTAILLRADWAAALTRVELYQATVPLSDRSESSQTRAFAEAMRVVLIRVTGARSVDEDAALAPLVASARRYVQQYRAGTDNQLMVVFDGAAIERWLTQNGQPLWGKERPATFVWLAATGSGAGTIVTADDASELKKSLDAAADLRGLPLIWPTSADVQRNHLDANAVANGSAALTDIARRLGGDGVLIGRAASLTAVSAVHWTFSFQDRSSEFSGAAEGVNRTADLFAGLYAASGSLVPIQIEVTGVNDLRDYAKIEAYLESLTFISRVGVISLGGDSMVFGLAARGGAEALQRALSLGGRLRPAGSGDNGIQRFELHH